MDQILYWNAVALESDRMAHTDIKPVERGSRGPAGSSRALAMVHLAMHDALFSIFGAPHGTWLTTPPVASNGAAPDAAIAVAAHTTLSVLYPTQTPRLDKALREAGLRGPGTGRGSTHGQAVGRAILKARAGDPNLSDTDYTPDTAPPGHRPDPVNPKQGYYAPRYGARSRCFAVTSRYTLDPPPKDNDPRYLAALREVRAKGIAAESMASLPAGWPARTTDETLRGLFWAYDGAKQLGSLPRLFNRITGEIAVARGNDVEQNARLFALVNTALADAAILCWDDKYRHNLWRPVLGIREFDPTLGPEAVPGTGLDADCDPGWLPYGAPRSNEIAANFTPPSPAYPSAHAALGGAALQTIRRYYDVAAEGPDILADGMGFVSEELDGRTTDNHGVQRPRHVRRFPGGLWQMMEENARSRVFLGVAWSFDAYATDPAGHMDLSQNVGGVRLGRDVADDLWAGGLRQDQAAGPRLP
ncbi:vanadium-dependent haloperoxidase [Nocardia concava]|uniref:vanadium-dependent haloperoxidase n=1 Tax=Nocardia concava TaxID=257281 RepID=UPI0002D3B7EB|nr:vanadium-dependent haloperoxidase [Nocardia concava]